jgi:DNA-binding NarL/FixJ family response regulator
MSRLHIIICDDHRTLREALAGYLCSQPAVASARVASNADEAIRLARRGGDVLVLDLTLGHGESGLEVLEALHNLGIGIRVLAIDTANDLDLVAHALARGAMGYCPKTARPQALYEAILQVGAGKAVIPDVVLGPLLRKLRQRQRVTEESSAVLARLTARERDVLRLLVDGVSRPEIARRLNLSSNTVRTHLRHLTDKLGVNTQLAAAARARELFDATDGAVPSSDPGGARVIDLRQGERDNCLGG